MVDLKRRPPPCLRSHSRTVWSYEPVAQTYCGMQDGNKREKNALRESRWRSEKSQGSESSGEKGEKGEGSEGSEYGEGKE